MDLGAAERIRAAEALATTLEQLPEFVVDANVAGYWAVRGEPPLNLAYGRLRAREQKYFLPLVTSAGALEFAEWRPGTEVQPNRYGIPEPRSDVRHAASHMDLILVPLLGFDRAGNRLGSGAGYYDRTFAFLNQLPRPAQPVLVGIGYHFQEVPRLEPESWDVAMDFIATDRELIDCAATRGT